MRLQNSNNFVRAGGVTKYRGGCRVCIIPAGYVGCAFWAGLFVAMSGSRIGATIVTGCITTSLIVSLWCVHGKRRPARRINYNIPHNLTVRFAIHSYHPNGIIVAITLVFTAINLGAILIDWFVFTPVVRYLAEFYGVFIGFYSVIDIYDDLVTRTAEGSDAVACHQLIPCCFPRCVGVQFWITAFIFQVVGLYLALVWQLSNID